jgi:hypothetical protein
MTEVCRRRKNQGGGICAFDFDFAAFHKGAPAFAQDFQKAAEFHPYFAFKLMPFAARNGFAFDDDAGRMDGARAAVLLACKRSRKRQARRFIAGQAHDDYLLDRRGEDFAGEERLAGAVSDARDARVNV